MVQYGDDLMSLIFWVFVLKWASFILQEALRRRGWGASHGWGALYLVSSVSSGIDSTGSSFALVQLLACAGLLPRIGWHGNDLIQRFVSDSYWILRD